MIIGVGTDICDVRRIRASLERRGDRFAAKVLGPTEFQIYQARKSRAESRGIAYVATRFSAKEAFSKAIGTGMHMPMTWRACEILNEPSGKPVIRLNGALAAWFEAQGYSAHVSVTDEQDYAASFVVIEKAAAANPPVARPVTPLVAPPIVTP